MSRRHAYNWNHPSHYLVDHTPDLGHQMVTVMVMKDLPPSVQCQSALPLWDTAFSKFDDGNPWSSSYVWSNVKVTFDLQHSKVKVIVKIKPIGHIWGLEFNICLLFVPWQSDHFWLRYNKFHIWPWNFKVKVMAKVKSDGFIWALDFNRCFCFSFRGNQPF